MSATPVFFTIVIPTLNEEQCISLLLRDLMAQSCQDFEVKVVDGHSQDKTVQKAQSFSRKLPVSVISAKKRNLSYQRNFGAAQSRGKYLVFIDADSRIPKNFLQVLYRTLKKYRYLIALPYIEFEEYATPPTAGGAVLRPFVPLINTSVEASQLLPRPFVTGGLMIIERHMFEHLGGFSVKRSADKKKLFAEDVDLLIRAKKMGVLAKKLSRPSYVFSMRRYRKEGSISVLLKYFLSFIDFTNGNLSGRVSYEMGGQAYK